MGSGFYALKQVSINELMAPWFLLRGRLRELDTLERVQDAWRRVLSTRQASDGGACGNGLVVQLVGLANLLCLLLSLGVGGAPACSSYLHHQPCRRFGELPARDSHSRPLETRLGRGKRGAPSVCRMQTRALWEAG